MSRRALAWFLSVPLIGAGVEGGHWLIYRLVYPNAAVRAQVLAQTGHQYLEYAPLVFAVAGAVALCAFWSRIFLRGQRSDGVTAQVSLLPFLAAAPAAFALQECLERLFLGTWPFSAAFDPTFLPGVALQFPVALLVFALARWLLRAADRLRLLVLGEGTARVFVVPLPRKARSRLVELHRPAALAVGFGERGPPALAPALALPL